MLLLALFRESSFHNEQLGIQRVAATQATERKCWLGDEP